MVNMNNKLNLTMLMFKFCFIDTEALANHNEAMFHLTRVTEEKKSLQRSLNEYINNHCNCDKVYNYLLVCVLLDT